MTDSQNISELEEQLTELMTGTSIDSLNLGLSIAEYSEEMTGQEKRDFLLKVISEINKKINQTIKDRKEALDNENDEQALFLKKQIASMIRLKMRINSVQMTLFHYL